MTLHEIEINDMMFIVSAAGSDEYDVFYYDVKCWGSSNQDFTISSDSKKLSKKEAQNLIVKELIEHDKQRAREEALSDLWNYEILVFHAKEEDWTSLKTGQIVRKSVGKFRSSTAGPEYHRSTADDGDACIIIDQGETKYTGYFKSLEDAVRAL